MWRRNISISSQYSWRINGNGMAWHQLFEKIMAAIIMCGHGVAAAKKAGRKK